MKNLSKRICGLLKGDAAIKNKFLIKGLNLIFGFQSIFHPDYWWVAVELNRPSNLSFNLYCRLQLSDLMSRLASEIEVRVE